MHPEYSPLTLVDPHDCILDALAVAQANISILGDRGMPESRFERFAFNLAKRSLELEQGMTPADAEEMLLDVAEKSRHPLHALLNQMSFGAIRALAKKTTELIEELDHAETAI